MYYEKIVKTHTKSYYKYDCKFSDILILQNDKEKIMIKTKLHNPDKFNNVNTIEHVRTPNIIKRHTLRKIKL